MIYACRIKDGRVNFSNRYVDTNKLKQEKAAGHPLGLKVCLCHTHCTAFVLSSQTVTWKQESCGSEAIRQYCTTVLYYQ